MRDSRDCEPGDTSFELIHNQRAIRTIEVSDQGHGACAVVDVDTLCPTARARISLGKGAPAKVSSRVGAEWKMIMPTGLLEY